MPLVDFKSHQHFIQCYAGKPLDVSILEFYEPIMLSVGDRTKAVGNRAGAYFDFRPWMYRIDPKMATAQEAVFSKQGCLFVSNLRYPGPRARTGRNANITFDYRCLLCSGHVDGYRPPPPPYDDNEPCHDVLKGIINLEKLADVAAFRRCSDGVLVMRDDWGWETLGGEEEVEAIYRREVKYCFSKFKSEREIL